MAKIIDTIKNWGHLKIDLTIFHTTSNALGLFNMDIQDILKHYSLTIQHLLNSKDIHFTTTNQKHFQIFNNVKKNFNVQADKNSIISFMVSANKNLKKQSKKKILKYKNSVKEIIESKKFDQCIMLDHFKLVLVKQIKH